MGSIVALVVFSVFLLVSMFKNWETMAIAFGLAVLVVGCDLAEKSSGVFIKVEQCEW